MSDADDERLLAEFVSSAAPINRQNLLDDLRAAIGRALARLAAPVPLILHCPMCHARHVDEGDQATRPHRTHACQNPRCGHLWAPAVVATVGVWTLPGCLNSPSPAVHDWVPMHKASDVERCSRCPVQRRRHDVLSWQYRLDGVTQLGWVVADESPPCRPARRERAYRWDGAGSLGRPCPACGAPPNLRCLSGPGLPKVTVGEHDATTHEERCWVEASP